jgi:hypothetical protein
VESKVCDFAAASKRACIGGNAGPIWKADSFDGDGMSAISIVHTKSGFIVAADGLICSTDQSVSTLRSVTAQKIFRAQIMGQECAWVTIGTIYNNDKTFDLPSETAKAIDLVGSTNCASLEDCAHAIADKINDYLVQARKLDQVVFNPANPNIALIYLVGYFYRSLPSLATLTFTQNAQGINDPRVETTTSPANRFDGSYQVATMYNRGPAHSAFGKYYQPSGPLLADGLAHATGFIRACMDPEALTVDPGCKYIGGRIHAAFVTPHGGFRWAPGYEPMDI